MARIRTIKPEFWTSEQVMACDPLTRLLFIGIWNFCDDAGNHPLSEKTLKALVFPGDDIDSSSVRRMIVELSSNALLRLYECGGKFYLNVCGWKHQKIDRPTIKHPDFDDGMQVFPEDIWPVADVVDDNSSSIRRAFVEASPPEEEREGKGREGKGKGNNSSLKTFDAFWSLYPNKKGKEAARKAWDKINPGDELLKTIMEALGKQSCSADWLKDGGQFIPHPTTWLNQKRWEDEIRQAAPGITKHTGFDERDYHAGLFEREDGTHGF